MFFLEIISWKDVSCFNRRGGGERGGGWASFLSGGGAPWGRHRFWLREFSKEFSKEFYILERVSFEQHEEFQMMLS